MSVLLVVAAHPDDEVLGVGATIARRVSNGDLAYALILGEGQTSRWHQRQLADEHAVLSLHQDSEAAAQIIGFAGIFHESLPDNRFDSVALLEVVKLVDTYIKRIKPDTVYTHHAHDLNIDHRITYEAVLTATRPIGDYLVKDIYGFETVSSTVWYFGNKEGAFFPNVFVDAESI